MGALLIFITIYRFKDHLQIIHLDLVTSDRYTVRLNVDLQYWPTILAQDIFLHNNVEKASCSVSLSSLCLLGF